MKQTPCFDWMWCIALTCDSCWWSFSSCCTKYQIPKYFVPLSRAAGVVLSLGGSLGSGRIMGLCVKRRGLLILRWCNFNASIHYIHNPMVLYMAGNSPRPHCLCQVCVYVCVWVYISDQPGQGDSCPMRISCVCMSCCSEFSLLFICRQTQQQADSLILPFRFQS